MGSLSQMIRFGLLLAILVGAMAPCAARRNLMEYYDPDNKEIPVLVFCSDDPQRIGSRFLARPGVEYLPLSELENRKQDLDRLPVVFLIARENLMTLPPALLEAMPMLASVRPNRVFIYGDTPQDRCAYKSERGRTIKYERTRLVVVAPTVRWLERTIDVVKTLEDLPAREVKARTPRFPNPLSANVRIATVVCDKAKAAVPFFLQTMHRGESQGLGGIGALNLRRSLQAGSPPPLALVATPSEAEEHQKWREYSEEAYLFLYEELAGLPEAVRKRLPYDVSKLQPNQTLAIRRPKPEGGRVSCFVAPSAPLMQSLLDRARSIAPTPAGEVKSVPDLRHVQTVLVAGSVSGMNTGRPEDAALAEQVERQVADAISNARFFPGVRSGQAEGQELRAVLGTLRLEASGLTKKDREDLNVIANVDALVMVSVNRAEGHTTYQVQRTKLTPDEPPFREPQEPSKPNPNARRYGILGPKLYPKGENDPKYKERLESWEKEHDEWEIERDKEKREYERALARKQYEWRWCVTQSSEAIVETTVRVFDLKTGAVIWATPPLQGKATATAAYKEQTLVVTGQNSRPRDPEQTPASENSAPAQLYARAATEAMSGFVQSLRANVLLPGDLPGMELGPRTETAAHEDIEMPRTRAAIDSAPKAIEPAPKVEGTVATILEVRQEEVILIGGKDVGLEAGEILIAVTEMDVRKDRNGRVLDVIEIAAVPLRVTQVHNRTSDCVPLKPETLAALRADLPLRRPRAGDPVPAAAPAAEPTAPGATPGGDS